MKEQRLERTKAVMASGAIALVVAALAFGISSSLLGPRSTSSRIGFDLTSGTSSFTITSTIYPSPACSGASALLYPGTARCMVFSVHNNLKAAISVQSIAAALDATNYPAPPADCAGTNLVLPTFSGAFTVTGGGNATSPGVPVELKDDGAPQNDCESSSYHFVYTGRGTYTEVYGTSTGLTSSQNPSTAGQSVTYTATVTASATSSQDPVPSSPTGTVAFKDNGTTICTAPVAVTSTGSTTATAQCTVSYATTAGSPHPLSASYANADGNFTNSSASLSQAVTPTTIATTSSISSSPNPSVHGNSVTFTDAVSSGSGVPTGSVTFYSCTTSSCSTKTSLGTGNLTSGKATLSTSALPVGTTFVEAIYAGSGNYLTGTSNVVSQAVTPTTIATTSSISSSPNPSVHGNSVTFTDAVSSGSGVPTGSVTFYSCTTSSCSTKTSLGTGNLTSGKATLSTSALPVGTTFVEAIYAGSGNYLTGTSNVVSQAVTPTTIATTSSISSSPNPSVHGNSVTFTDAVSSGSGVPTGSVTFYSCTTSSCSTKTSLGTGNLTSGKATLSTSALPVGTTFVEAIYAGSGNYLTGTSNVVSQMVNPNAPAICAPSGYSNYLFGNPFFPIVYGTNANDFITALGGNYWINGFGGNDCVDAGDGGNVIFDGGGNDGVVSGNGNNVVILGNGNDKVSLGNGSDAVATGDGTDNVSLGNGSQSELSVGNGNDTVTVGTGSYNQVHLGNGVDTITIQSSGSHDDINGGNGNETISLGSGTGNSYSGQPHRTNVCHLPVPPSSWHGSAVSYYHDTVTNCTVVTP